MQPNPYESPLHEASSSPESILDLESVAVESSDNSSVAFNTFCRSKKVNCLLFLLIWGLTSGGLRGLLGEGLATVLVYIDVVVLCLAGIYWVRLDAALRDIELWRYFVTAMIIFPGPLVVMPVYFVKSRGWLRGAVAVVLAFGFVLCQSFVAELAALLMFRITAPSPSYFE